MSYTPVHRDSNGDGWCQVKIVDEMFLFAWSWWSSDQHARIKSNGRVSASLDSTWLKTTKWWLLAYGHPAVAQTVIALQRIVDTAWRISSLIPGSLWLIFILTSMSIIGRSNIQAHARHEWSTFLQGIDTNCWTGSVQRRNGWAMLSHFKPMLATFPPTGKAAEYPPSEQNIYLPFEMYFYCIFHWGVSVALLVIVPSLKECASHSIEWYIV